jgi:membrane-bound metal-dependent hydrolase YbcI (DUF457 family)
MFIGHFGLGMAGKGTLRRPSLFVYLMAAQWLDLIWPIFLLLGWEHVKIVGGNNPLLNISFIYYPFSHSLLFSVIWSLIYGSVYYFFKKDLPSSLVLGFLVFSHWLLDFFTHIPDLPMGPWDGYRVGLGLWNYPMVTVIVESIIFFLGIILYLRSTRSNGIAGHISFWSLVLLLVFFYISSFYSPPPDSEKSLGVFAMAQWLLLALAYWIDRTRTSI